MSMTCLIIDIADHPGSGVPDTCIHIDLDVLDPATLPDVPEITAITLAELHQGVASAKNPAIGAAWTELLGAAIVDVDPLPFDGEAAARYLEDAVTVVPVSK
ncbi:MAG: hypothetical protein V7646_6993 [Pseudonocardia sp.]